MLGKVKSFFGIESVKLSLVVPAEITMESGILKGRINISSMSNQVIKSIEIRLIERYQRGRGEKKLINEYEAGKMVSEKSFKIDANKELSFEFELPYQIARSEMDKIGSSNFLSKAFVKAAKYLHGVKSDFRIEASAKVQGNAISPLAVEHIFVKI
ncbi:MAG: sporulation protein [Deltaproteobacteria bacterium]